MDHCFQLDGHFKSTTLGTNWLRGISALLISGIQKFWTVNLVTGPSKFQQLIHRCVLWLTHQKIIAGIVCVAVALMWQHFYAKWKVCNERIRFIFYVIWSIHMILYTLYARVVYVPFNLFMCFCVRLHV